MNINEPTTKAVGSWCVKKWNRRLQSSDYHKKEVARTLRQPLLIFSTIIFTLLRGNNPISSQTS